MNIEVIDLTGSDNEDDVSQVHQELSPTRPLPLVTKAHSNHGLSYGSFVPHSANSNTRNIPNNFKKRLQSAGHGTRRKHRTSQQQYGLSNAASYSEGSHKRQRLDSNSFKRVLSATDHLSRSQPVIIDLEAVPNNGLLAAGQSRITAPPVMGTNIRTALDKQVFPCIKGALKPYSNTISRDNRKKIGKKVAHELCHPEFLNELYKSGGLLSKLYEAQIKLQAEDRVKHHVGELERLLAVSPSVQDLGEGGILESLEMPIQRLKTKSTQASTIQVPTASLSTGELSHGLIELSSSAPKTTGTESITTKDDDQEIPAGYTKRTGVTVVEDYFAKQALSKSQTPPSMNNPHTIQPPQVSDNLKSRELALQTHKSRPTNEIFTNEIRDGPLLSESQTQAVQLSNKLRLVGLDEDISRPYLRARDRDCTRDLAFAPRNSRMTNIYQAETLHVDFTEEEVELVATLMRQGTKRGAALELCGNLLKNLRSIIKDRPGEAARLAKRLNALNLQTPSLRRSEAALEGFLQDTIDGEVSCANPSIMRLQAAPKVRHSMSALGVTKLLLSRSINGDNFRGTGNRSIRSQLITTVEDSLARRAEWSDCSGDINTISWTPRNEFICGAIAHSDSHNMQYNKAGNLIHGAVTSSNAFSVANHRIPRPIVEKGENSTAAMRETQDPWIYSSVACTAYKDGKCLTGSYDGTVKIWRFESGILTSLGEWEHDGHVNFVVTSPHHGMVATAADVGQAAIRVYDLEIAGDEPSAAPLNTFSGDKANELAIARTQHKINWAYHVATLAWGKSASVAHLLLAGYSPRSYDCDDADIPEERAHTGELCMWDVTDGSKVTIAAAKSQNVFEVVWHPTQPIFVAATSPTGEYEDDIRTQLRLFGQTKQGSFNVIKTLDCTALDINEITIMPTSILEAYVTASCTDGATYVWDTAHSELPLHVLQHSDSIDALEDGYDREETDVGVRFVAWGKTVDRLYTGSSDGVLKAWDVQAPPDDAFIRDVLNLSGGISAGAFSQDFENLIIGDATGKIHLLAIDGPGDTHDDDVESQISVPSLSVGGRAWDGTTMIRKPIVPHPLDASTSNGFMDIEEAHRSAADIGHEFIARNQLIIKDPYIGVVQGPEYSTTGLFRADAHKDNNPTRKIRRAFRNNNTIYSLQHHSQEAVQFPHLCKVVPSNCHNHKKNLRLEELDRGYAGLSLEDRSILEAEGVDFDFKPELEDFGQDYSTGSNQEADGDNDEDSMFS